VKKEDRAEFIEDYLREKGSSNFLYIKRPVVEIFLDIKNKIMSSVDTNITGWQCSN